MKISQFIVAGALASLLAMPAAAAINVSFGSAPSTGVIATTGFSNLANLNNPLLYTEDGIDVEFVGSSPTGVQGNYLSPTDKSWRCPTCIGYAEVSLANGDLFNGLYLDAAHTNALNPTGVQYFHMRVFEGLVSTDIAIGQLDWKTLKSIRIQSDAGDTITSVWLAVNPSTGFAFSSNSANLMTMDNIAITSAAVPEPATWAMMIMGFGAMGSILRRRKAAYA